MSTKSCSRRTTSQNGGGWAVFAVVLVAVLFSRAEMPSVAVSASDAETGEVTLAIETGGQQLYLFAGYDKGDRGTDASAWDTLEYVKMVESGETSATHMLPKVWRKTSGAVRFFLFTPTDTSKVEGPSLTTDGIAWIDTGIRADINTETTLRVREVVNRPSFGNALRYYIFITDNPYKFQYSFSNAGAILYDASEEPHTSDGKPHTLSLSRAGAFVDNLKKVGPWDNPTAFEVSGTMPLFGRRKADETALSHTPGGTIYWATIVTNGVTARSFRPMKIAGEGVLFDEVTQTVFHNAADSGVFTYNAGVTPTDGTFAAVSAPLVLARTITIDRIDSWTRTVSLSFGGESRNGVLFMARAATDGGTDPAAWEDVELVARVSAGTSSFSATLPVTWWKAGGIARFFWCSAHDFPYDYPVKSLSSTSSGGQYVDTGVIPDKTTTTTVSYATPSGTDMAPFGNAEVNYLFANNRGIPYGFFGNIGQIQDVNRQNIPYAYTGIDCVYKLGPDGVFANGMLLAGPWTTFSGSTTYTSTLFARRYTDGTVAKFGPCTIYYATIERGGETIRSFVPCVKDNVGYFYDKATKRLFGNQGGAALVAGERVVPELMSGDVLCVSEQIVLGRGLQILVR